MRIRDLMIPASKNPSKKAVSPSPTPVIDRPPDGRDQSSTAAMALSFIVIGRSSSICPEKRMGPGRR